MGDEPDTDRGQPRKTTLRRGVRRRVSAQNLGVDNAPIRSRPPATVVTSAVFGGPATWATPMHYRRPTDKSCKRGYRVASVRCPEGHPNDLGQKFCGECGVALPAYSDILEPVPTCRPIQQPAEEYQAAPQHYQPPVDSPGTQFAAPTPTRRRHLASATAALSLLMAAAALVVACLALTRAPSDSAAARPNGADTAAADTALCTAIAPAMSDSVKWTNDYLDLGPPLSDKRAEALAKFQDDTKDWTRRAQQVLDNNPDASGYLRRTLQRYFDDSQLFADALSVFNPDGSFVESIYNESVATYGGPKNLCSHLGITWSTK